MPPPSSRTCQPSQSMWSPTVAPQNSAPAAGLLALAARDARNVSCAGRCQQVQCESVLGSLVETTQW